MVKINDDVFENIVNELAEAMFNDVCVDEPVIYPKEVKEVSDKLYQLFGDNDLTEEIKNDLSIAITATEGIHEKYGFITGFKKAIEILKAV